MSELLRKIQEAAANKRVAVEVPEWGTTLYFTPVTGREMVHIRAGISPKAREEHMIAAIQHKATDADGKLLFDTSARTRAELMASADMSVIMRIVNQSGGTSPREAALEVVDDDDIRRLLTSAADLDVVQAQELSPEVIEAFKRLLMLGDTALLMAMEAKTDLDSVKNG